MNRQLMDAGTRIDELQNEITAQQAEWKTVAEEYEAEIGRLDAERVAAIDWGRTNEAELEKSQTGFTKCLELFREAEVTIEERTHWAQSLDAENAGLRAQLEAIRESKWIRLGRSIGMVAEIKHAS